MSELNSRESDIRAAAFLEASGMIDIYKYQATKHRWVYPIRCRLYSGSHVIPQWLTSNYHGSFVFRQNHNSFTWEIKNALAETFIKQIYPYLLALQMQADCAFELRNVQGHFMKDVPQLEKELIWEQIYLKMKSINALGDSYIHNLNNERSAA